MNKTLTIFGAGFLVAGSLALNMIRYPVVWNIVGAPPENQRAVAADVQSAVAAKHTDFLPTTPPPQETAAPSPPNDAAPSFAIDRLPPTEDSATEERTAFGGVEQPPSGSLGTPVVAPSPGAAPLGRYEMPTTPAAAATAAAQAAADPSPAVPQGKPWPAEQAQTSFALSSPALRPLDDKTEVRRLQPVDPVSEPVGPSLAPTQDDPLMHLPPIDAASAPLTVDLNSPSPDGTVQIYPRAEGR